MESILPSWLEIYICIFHRFVFWLFDISELFTFDSDNFAVQIADHFLRLLQHMTCPLSLTMELTAKNLYNQTYQQIFH